MLAITSAQTLSDVSEVVAYEKQQKFNTLVQEHSSYLYRYAYWRCQDHTLAEDLVQETYLRAWKHLHQLQDLVAAKSWLTTILRREHARIYERQQAHIDPETSPDSLPGAIDNDTRPEAFALREALAKLPEKYREPLVLQVLGGFSLEDIASILNLSKGAVMTRVFRAKQKLRSALKPNSGH